MLVNLNQVLQDAKQKKYGVGLFNTVNLEMAKGVLAAAEESRSPVIIGTAEVLLPFAGLDDLASFLIPLAKKATVPVVVHFDHGLTKDAILHAMDLGFSSIMYDCSTLGFEDNCTEVASMVKTAHLRGITVEAELGHVGANASSAEGINSESSDSSIYTEPQEALDFYKATGVDALAVAIGTAHGAYKSTPKLDFERLKVIASMVTAPIVLHGGSGLSEQDFKKSIACGVSKVNIFTDINCAAAKAAHDNYKTGSGMTDVMPAITEAVKQATLEKMRIFGSVGRA